MKSAKVILFSFLLLSLVTGCVRNALEERQYQLCTRLQTINNAILTLRSANTTVSDKRQAIVQAGEALRGIELVAKDIPVEDIQALEGAYKELEKSVEELPAQSTANQVAALISNKVTTLESVVKRTQSRLRCLSAKAASQRYSPLVATISLQVGRNRRRC